MSSGVELGKPSSDCEHGGPSQEIMSAVKRKFQEVEDAPEMGLQRVNLCGLISHFEG